MTSDDSFKEEKLKLGIVLLFINKEYGGESVFSILKINDLISI